MWQGSHFSLGPRWCSINPWSCWPGSALGNQVSLSTCHYLKPVLLCILGLFITNVVYFITSAIFQSTPIIRFCRYQQTTNGSHSFQDGRIHKTDSRSDQCLWQPSITVDIILTVIVVFVNFFFFFGNWKQWCQSITLSSCCANISYYMSKNCLFCPTNSSEPKDSPFTIINGKEKAANCHT